ncbi:SDR family NAD(P)-dependent oxidoreductase, partial [Acinetobacter baumannii]
MYEHYSGQVVLITGAASGFGALLAQQLAEHGAKLVLGDRNIAGLNAVVEP